jgi:hypothetical protein
MQTSKKNAISIDWPHYLARNENLEFIQAIPNTINR